VVHWSNYGNDLYGFNCGRRSELTDEIGLKGEEMKKWIWLNLGNISLVWIAEIWTITATESKKSIIIASPNGFASWYKEDEVEIIMKEEQALRGGKEKGNG